MDITKRHPGKDRIGNKERVRSKVEKDEKKRDKLKRDIGLERKILFEIEEKYQPGHIWISNLRIEGYPVLKVAEHCRLLYEQGLISKYKPLDDGRGELISYKISDLTARGYDYLELIRNEKVWKKSLKEADDRQVPKTTENIAEIAGIFVGNVIKEISGIP